MVGTRMSRVVAGLVGAGLAIGGLGPVASAAAAEDRPPDGVRRVVFVGNNWGGTADVLSPGTLRRIGTIDVVPDSSGAAAGDPERPLPAGLLPRDPRPDR